MGKLVVLDIEKLKKKAKEIGCCAWVARKKLKILEKAGFKCEKCGAVEKLTFSSEKNSYRKKEECDFDKMAGQVLQGTGVMRGLPHKIAYR